MTEQSNVYIHPKPASFVSKVLNFVMRIGGIKSTLKKVLKDPASKNAPEAMPKAFAKKYKVETETFEGRELWTIGPKDGTYEQVLFYVHGGAYVFNVTGLHWTFFGKTVDETKAKIVVANYPLIPKGTAQESHEYLQKLYKQTLERYPEHVPSFMGDSAGGGLVIAFAQYIRGRQLPQPKQIIVLSPWLDITMSNPDMEAIDKQDHALHRESLRKAGEMFAGGLSPKDPRVSPIYGSFEGVAKISIFTGTYEIFVADIRKLKKRLDAEQIPLNYYEYPKMAHTWVLLPVKEAAHGFAQMMELLKQ